VRMHYYRLTVRRKRPGLGIEELLAITRKAKPVAKRPEGDSTFVVAVGDLQLGKIDGDGAEGTVERAVSGLYEAADRLKSIRKYKSVGPVHIAWLGDCIEGFVSQGGANAWRTTLTVTEQLRLLRRIMLKSIEIFAPVADIMTCVAVPGNHDQAIRFGRSGVTRYDDSFDIDALLAVSDACAISDAYSHVKFYVPETDEMSVTLDVSGTKLGHIHGHQTKARQHFTWWSKQAFGDQQIGQADVLLAGHFHHFVYDTSGKRKFIQVPALESESTWFRHHYGEVGDPGILTFVTKDASINNIEIV
jgi:predicted phosphodiesterase